MCVALCALGVCVCCTPPAASALVPAIGGVQRAQQSTATANDWLCRVDIDAHHARARPAQSVEPASQPAPTLPSHGPAAARREQGR